MQHILDFWHTLQGLYLWPVIWAIIRILATSFAEASDLSHSARFWAIAASALA